MNKCPQLSDMGVTQPQQIDSYSVNSIGYTDVLRVVYERPKGSILPRSKTFHFPRVQQSTDSAAPGEDGTVMSTHPCLRKAVTELDELLATKERVVDVAARISEELAILQEDVAHRSECIKSLLKKLPAVKTDS